MKRRQEEKIIHFETQINAARMGRVTKSDCRGNKGRKGVWRGNPSEAIGVDDNQKSKCEWGGYLNGRPASVVLAALC